MPQSVRLSVPFELVPKASINRLFGKNGAGGWKNFYSKFPDSGGFITMSAVGFNVDKTVAVVYVGHRCGSLCGGGRYHFLQKTNGKWSEVNWQGTMCTWVS